MISQVLVLFLLGAAASAGDDPVVEQKLILASSLVDLRADDAKPFQLELNFRAQNLVSQDGHLTLKWAAKDRWWQLVTMGDYQQLEVRKGDTLYLSRNAPFTPLRISELIALMRVFSADAEHERAKKVSDYAEGDVIADCMELQERSHHAWNAQRQVCINRASNEVLSDDVREASDIHRKEFADYQTFRSHRYPWQLKYIENSSVALKVQIVSLQEAAFEDALFVAPPGAIARRQCEHMVPPIAIKQPDPAYPRSAAQNGIGGTTTVTLTVMPDGSVDNVQLVRPASREMNQATQDTVKKWKFKPAMCGNEPVAADIRVEMNFRLGGY
jgi:TonB family protein